ncbi:hypothetical protein BRE01_24770 [Brevibacillus reuszeri]|uniref:Uncharacterized protein n=1 Tax=Brevibacillus reuszeri TaxID=54915 RepID=A0ABQ0TLF4_9BACL|nr:hypothetical protein BRE01_24770 [Brevibacillus reuszeri]
MGNSDSSLDICIYDPNHDRFLGHGPNLEGVDTLVLAEMDNKKNARKKIDHRKTGHRTKIAMTATAHSDNTCCRPLSSYF